MRLLRQLGFIAVMCLQWLPAFGADSITNFVSSVVSYQYPDDLSSEALADGGIQSPFLSFQYLEYFDSASLTNGGVVSPIISYQYFEWPGDDVLKLQSSLVVSYYYQFSRTPGLANVHGRVSDLNGLPLVGATVSALVYLSPVAQTTTDANGNYQLPPLDAGVYDLWALESTHQTSIRAFTLGSSTVEQNFQLRPMPTAPVVQQTSRQPDLSATIGLMGSALRVFDGTQFQPITLDNAPTSNRMTIVLTHGWNSDPSVWAQGMATQMWAQGVTTNIVNIVTWDWHAAAAGFLPPEENTPSQGVALGQALLGTLGANYSKPVHFIGHSLGPLVNAAAANYLHGDRTAQQDISPTPWNVLVHATLLDEAEAASVFGSAFALYDGFTVVLQNFSASLPPASETLRWKSATPLYLTWADNYVSEFGLPQANTVNVILAESSGTFVQRHAYAYAWYGMTIANPSGCTLGFQRSYEAREADLSTFDFLQAQIDFPSGAYYLQPSTAIDPLTLVYQSSVNSPIGNLPEKIVQSAIGVVQLAGNAVIQVNSAAQTAGQLISQTFNYVDNLAGQGEQAMVGLFDSAVLHLTLTTASSSALSPQLRGGWSRPLGKQDGSNGNNTPAMVWVPLQFPTNGSAMAFDFIVSGSPADDSLVCGIGTNLLFSLQAKYIPTNSVSASRLIDVTPWAGATNELFFGFLGGTSTNAALEIDNIRFYNVLPPRLNMQLTKSAVEVNWPLSASGYMLEASDNLAAADLWSPVTNTPAIVNGQFTITDQIYQSDRFYRLRK